MGFLDGWLSSGGVGLLSASQRAALAWRRIQDRPTEITIRRGSGSAQTILESQVVRLEWDNTATEAEGINTTEARQKVVVFGVRGHDTVEDTDIERSDQFSINGVRYMVFSIMTPPGEVQAVCESVRNS